MTKIITFLMLFSGLSSCAQTQKGNLMMETFDQYRTQQIEEKDSLYILYTVKEWSKKNWYTWEDYSKMYNTTGNDVEYFIAGTFYNQNKTKLLVWVGQKVPNVSTQKKYSDNLESNRLCPSAGDTIFNLSALIGIRDSVNQIWELYPFNQQQATCCNTKAQAINILGRYYFDAMKTHQMYRVMQSGIKKGSLLLQPYGYNLQDELFWDKCWLFQKDTICSYGLYPFQIKQYDCSLKDYDVVVETHPFQKQDETNGEYAARNGPIVMKPFKVNPRECAESFKPPVVDYPEKILNLYKR